MTKQVLENAIIIKNKTRLEQLTARFNTQAQAKFYITQSQKQFYAQQASRAQDGQGQQSQQGQQGQKQSVILQKSKSKIKGAVETQPEKPKKTEKAPDDFAHYEQEHQLFYQVLSQVQRIAGLHLKVKVLEREFIASYIFSDKDLIIVVGQDGLVANTAKYVGGRSMVAVNPDPNNFDGILLPYTVNNLAPAIEAVLAGNYTYTDITMAEVKLNDGQRLLAFNDLFIGPVNHGSARYRLTFEGRSAVHSSSGIIVSTGAGSTGWLSSLYNMARGINIFMGGEEFFDYVAIPMDSPELVFIVREPFLSKTSTTELVAGSITENCELIIESHMPTGGVIFSDGIQSDYLPFNSGAIATIRIAPEKARLVGK